MKKLTIILLSFIYGISCFAQTNSADVAKQINAIKMNKDYITAESTAETSEKAYENARALLEVNIEEWIKSTKTTEDIQGFIAKSGNSFLELKTMRGNRFRTFLYVKKSDIMTFKEPTDIIVAAMQSDNPQQTVVVVPPTEKVTQQPTETEKVYLPNEEEKRMLQINKSSLIEQFIKQNSTIVAYGKFKDLPQTGDCYLFVYNPEGNVPAVLLRNNAGYINVRNGNHDNIENYKGCGAIWFRYNKQ